MVSSCLRLVFIVGLSLNSFTSAYHLLPDCQDLPEGEDNSPRIVERLKVVQNDTNYKPDGSSKVVNRPRCDLTIDKVFIQLSEYFDRTTSVKNDQKKGAYRSSSNAVPIPVLAVMAGGIAGRAGEFGSLEGSNVTVVPHNAPVPQGATVWYGYVQGASSIFIKAKGSEPCFILQSKYLGEALNRKVAEPAVEKLRSYQDSLDQIGKAAEELCSKCDLTDTSTICLPKCDTQYNAKLQEFYEKVKADRAELVEANRGELWNGYLLKDFCNIQFVTAAEIASTSRIQRDTASYTQFRDNVKTDAAECLQTLAQSIDYAIQNVNETELANASPYRAYVYRDLNEWLKTFDLLSDTKGVGLGEHGTELRHEANVMIRDTSKGWFSCSAADLEDGFCEWTSCPANGPEFNDAGDHQSWTDCKNEVLTIKKVTYEDGDDGIIHANENVYLFNHESGRLYWATAPDDKTTEKNCKKAERLVFKCAKEDVSTEQANFIVEAYDWNGRQREAGETVRSRDYIVFKYNSPPEYQKLKAGGGLFYIEGFLFIGGQNSS